MVCLSCSAPMATGARVCSRCGFSAANPAVARRGKFPLGLKIIFVVPLFWLAATAVYFARYMWSSAYRGGLEMAESSVTAQQALGEKIHVSGMPVGSIKERDGVQAVQWTVPVRGEHGTGKLYGAANNATGPWEYSVLTLVPDNQALKKINLAPTPARQDIPAGFRKAVYLVPIDLSPDESLDWAPDYYKAMFDVDVRVLPAIAASSTDWDQTRHQVIAEQCLGLMQRKYPELAEDATVALVGVTSNDMYIRNFDRWHAKGYYSGSRSAMVSSAGLEPTGLFERRNHELRYSRLQKLITQDVAHFALGLPQSKDPTSSLYYGLSSSSGFEFTSERITGASGTWQPNPVQGEPMMIVTASKGKPVVWEMGGGGRLGLHAETFTVNMPIGFFIERHVDFSFGEEVPMSFTRCYTTRDNTSGPFGIGATDSLDIYLVGKMGSYVELILPDGTRIRFEHETRKTGEKVDRYLSKDVRFVSAEIQDELWRVKSKSGWTYLMPYKPKLSGWKVTALTGMIDDKGREYEMVRDDAGDLTQMTTPSGKILNIAYGDGHRIREAHDSAGNWARYSYDAGGRLIRVEESDGSTETYAYDEKNNMLSARNGTNPPVIVNQFNANGLITKETLADGQEFEYGYTMGPKTTILRSTFRQPGGVTTFFEYTDEGYLQSLPTR